MVTGSTKGIGRAMVQGLAEAGASVVVSSRKQDLCDEVAEEVAAATGAETFGRACHVGDWDAIPGFVDAVVERFGRIDVLVNNAGISPSRSGVSDMTLDLWRKIFAVNLEGPLRMSQCVAPVMRDGGGGSIINIGSMAGYHAGSAVSAYGASKAALLNISRTMAQEWVGWGVRVNVLSPGPFASDMVEGAEAQRPRLQGPDRRRHDDEPGRRARRDRRAGPLPGQRRLVVRHRRRHLRLRRDGQVGLSPRGRCRSTGRARPGVGCRPGARRRPRRPGGTSTSRVKVPSSIVHALRTRPRRASWTASAEVRPPPGIGATVKRS